MPDKRISEELASLREAFVAALPAKIQRLEQLLAECTDTLPAGASLPGEAWQAINLAVHSLAGSGGTFGFKQVGEAASALEQVLAPLLNGAARPDPDILQRVQAGVAAIRAASREPPTGLVRLTPPTRPGDSASGDERLIYLVEDDAELADSLAIQLRHFGYRVRVFRSPGDVASDANEGLPAAILMDIGFPEGPLAGPLAVRNALRQSFHGVPVLYISARGDFSARLEAVRADGKAYFTKPIDIGALVNALDEFSGDSRASPYRVLIVEDSESTAAFYRQVLLAAGMEPMVLLDPTQILVPLAEFGPDLILMDVYMPACNGIELATLIRQQPIFVGIPIVFLSTETNINRHLVAIRQGGDDFLSKPIDPARLISVITSRAARGRVLRAHMATDGLTGLLNHSHLKEQLETALLRSQRQGNPLVFAMIDADHFKRVNDTWGHAAGDRVLRSLAKLLRERLRRTDVAGRYGGEEFGLILTDIDAHTALPLLDRIRRDFGALRHVSGDAEFSVSFSAGIAEFPRHQQVDALIAAADAALYRAKLVGRDRIALDGD